MTQDRATTENPDPVHFASQKPLVVCYEEFAPLTKMAALRMGTKVCEVTGEVKCSSVEFMMSSCKQGSLALYRMASDLFYIHTIVTGGRKPPKLQVILRSKFYRVRYLS